jgi:hypothetical protein
MRKAELSARDERMRDLCAWQLVLPSDAVFTHVTAAWLFDWWLPRLPEFVPTFAATAAETRPRRAGLICSRLGAVAHDVQRFGLPVDHPAEVLIRAARDLACSTWSSSLMRRWLVATSRSTSCERWPSRDVQDRADCALRSP